MTSLFLPKQIEYWPLDRLRPYERNARTHPDDQIDKLAAAVVEFGWTQPITVNSEGEIVGGHGRLLAARKLGMAEVPVIRLDHLDEIRTRAARISDNRIGELSTWDEELLAAEMHMLNGAGYDPELTGFDGEALERLLAPLQDEGERARRSRRRRGTSAPKLPSQATLATQVAQ